MGATLSAARGPTWGCRGYPGDSLLFGTGSGCWGKLKAHRCNLPGNRPAVTGRTVCAVSDTGKVDRFLKCAGRGIRTLESRSNCRFSASRSF